MPQHQYVIQIFDSYEFSEHYKSYKLGLVYLAFADFYNQHHHFDDRHIKKSLGSDFFVKYPQFRGEAQESLFEFAGHRGQIKAFAKKHPEFKLI